ncbi:unnamed protein product, partial [Ilex paraguariensis]
MKPLRSNPQKIPTNSMLQTRKSNTRVKPSQSVLLEQSLLDQNPLRSNIPRWYGSDTVALKACGLWVVLACAFDSEAALKALTSID